MSPAATRRYRVTGSDFGPFEAVVLAASEAAAIAKASAIYSLDGLAGGSDDRYCVDWRAELVEPEIRS